jgi:hypothetical protein
VQEPESWQSDGVVPFLVGTVVWTLVLIGLLLGDYLNADRSWWVTTCLVGIGLGIFGLGWSLRRRDRRR